MSRSSAVVLLSLALFHGAPATGSETPRILLPEPRPAALTLPPGAEIASVSADGRLAAVAVHAGDDARPRATLHLLRAGGAAPATVELPGRVRDLLFLGEPPALFALHHRPAKRGEGQTRLIRVDLDQQKVSGEVRLPPSASGLAFWPREQALLVACRDEIRTLRMPWLRSAALFPVAGENRSIAVVAGSRALVGQAAGIVQVDLDDRPGREPMPVHDQAATPSPVVGVVLSADGRTGLAGLADGAILRLSLDPLRATVDPGRVGVVANRATAVPLVARSPAPAPRSDARPTPPAVPRESPPSVPPADPAPEAVSAATSPEREPAQAAARPRTPARPAPASGPPAASPPAPTADRGPGARPDPEPAEVVPRPATRAQETPRGTPVPLPPTTADLAPAGPPPVRAPVEAPTAPSSPAAETLPDGPPASPGPPPAPGAAPPAAAPPERPATSAARGEVRGRIGGAAADLVVAVVLFGPDAVLREAARVGPGRDGSWSARGLAPGRYRIVLDGGGTRVLVADPPVRWVDLGADAGVAGVDFDVLRGL